MVSRRQSLKVVISSLFVPVFETSPLARAAGLGKESRATEPACPTCANSEALKNIYANVLDSAALLKYVSLPQVLLPVKRSMRVGMPLQYVESATGNLTFAIADLVLKGMPGITFMRVYNSSSRVDHGLGAGWSINMDDRIAVTGSIATLSTASGDTVIFDANADRSVFSAQMSGLSVHKVISRVDANTLSEQVSADIARIYTRIGDVYCLSSFDYGLLGRLQIVRDADRRILSLQSTASGLRIDLAWSEQGQLTGLTDSAGRNVQFNYSGRALVGYKDSAGAQWQYEYAGGQLCRVVDPIGTEILGVEYASTRVVQSRTVAGSLRYDYGVTEGSPVASLTTSDANGRSWLYVHNAEGQIISVGARQLDRPTRPPLRCYWQLDGDDVCRRGAPVSIRPRRQADAAKQRKTRDAMGISQRRAAAEYDGRRGHNQFRIRRRRLRFQCDEQPQDTLVFSDQ